MKINRKFFAALRWGWTILKILAIVFIAFIGYIQLTDFRPSDKVPIELRGNRHELENVDGTLSIITWNIGYAGLGKEMDFFYDGGEMVRPDYRQHKNYLKGITEFLMANDSVEVFLLQEVDRNSRRSYEYNQMKHITDSLERFSGVFAKNYDVPFVPLPVTSPMGKVDAGMATFSKLRPKMTFRYALPQSHSWPMSLFMLDRAVIKSTFPFPDRKNLVVLNIHNSAYADEEAARAAELEVIKSIALEEYNKGNYVVIGGDWNQNPPDFKIQSIPKGKETGFTLQDDYIGKEWKWVYDEHEATNRSLKRPYSESSKKTIIDFYLLSPNLTVEEVEVLEQNFRFSDHEPVYIRFRLD